MSIVTNTTFEDWQGIDYRIRRDRGQLVPTMSKGSGNQQRYVCCNHYAVAAVVDYRYALVCNTCRTVHLSSLDAVKGEKESDIYEALGEAE